MKKGMTDKGQKTITHNIRELEGLRKRKRNRQNGRDRTRR